MLTIVLCIPPEFALKSGPSIAETDDPDGAHHRAQHTPRFRIN